MYKVIVSAVFFIVLNNSSNALAKDSTEANYYLNFSYGVAKHSLKEGDPDDKEHFDATTDAFSLNFDYRLSENFLMGFGYVNFGEAELWSEVESFSGGSDSRTLSTKGKGTTLNVKYQNDKILGDIGGYIKAGIINWDANYVFDWQSPGYSYYLNSASSGTDLFAGVAGLYHISDDLYLNLSLDWYQMKLKVVEDEDDSYSVDQGFLMYALGVTYRF